MSQAIKEVIVPDDGSSYPFQVDAENVFITTKDGKKISLQNFYSYIQAFFDESWFAAQGKDVPTSNDRIMFWYDTREE